MGQAVLEGAVGNVLGHSQLTLWSLFLSADWVVKAVMLVLLVASVWCWAIIFDKTLRFRRLQRRANQFEDEFWSGGSLEELYERVGYQPTDPMTAVFAAAMREWQRMTQMFDDDARPVLLGPAIALHANDAAAFLDVGNRDAHRGPLAAGAFRWIMADRLAILRVGRCRCSQCRQGERSDAGGGDEVAIHIKDPSSTVCEPAPWLPGMRDPRPPDISRVLTDCAELRLNFRRKQRSCCPVSAEAGLRIACERCGKGHHPRLLTLVSRA